MGVRIKKRVIKKEIEKLLVSSNLTEEQKKQIQEELLEVFDWHRLGFPGSSRKETLKRAVLKMKEYIEGKEF